MLGYNKKILNILLRKKKQGQLANFYHFKLNSNLDESSFITSWLSPFLGETLFNDQSSNIERLINNPDLLLVGKKIVEGQLISDKESPYTLDEIKPVIKFCSSSPWQGTHRIAVIFDAHRLNSIVANKLLKTLEEPASGNTIFLINSQNTQLLPTIKSRAISLRLSTFKPSTEQEFEIANKSLYKLISDPAANQLGEHYLRELTEQVANKGTYQQATQLLTLSKWFIKSKLFRNSTQERLSRLYLFDKSR